MLNKKVLLGFLVLVMFSLMAYFVISGSQMTDDLIKVDAPTISQNVSGNITLNANVTSNTTHGGKIVNVTFKWNLKSNKDLILGPKNLSL